MFVARAGLACLLRRRLLIVLPVSLVVLTGHASAQTVVDPTFLEFVPSADHNGTLPDGRPKIDHYQLEYRESGSLTAIGSISIGKPTVPSTGLIRVQVPASLIANAIPGRLYDFVLAAVGPSGSTVSQPSNGFSISGCTIAVTPTAQTIASNAVMSGGSGATSVVTKKGCSWNANSSAAWLTILSGQSGDGSGLVLYQAQPNTTRDARTGTMTVAGQQVSVTQLPAGPRPGKPARNDFDGDGRSDIAVYRPSTGEWFVRTSSTDFSVTGALTFQWGLPGDIPIPGDFDGDGRADVTVFRTSTSQWLIRYSSRGYDATKLGTEQWGQTGDIPLAADFDGDGRAEIAVYRPANHSWFIRYSTRNYDATRRDVLEWGADGDQPVVADFDGDGKADVTMYRPSTGDWFTRYSSRSFEVAQYTLSQWNHVRETPAAADFDADGRADLAMYLPASGVWSIRYSTRNYDAAQAASLTWGLNGDTPVVDDFDGDGTADISVLRPGNGEWGILVSSHAYDAASYTHLVDGGRAGDLSLSQNTLTALALQPASAPVQATGEGSAAAASSVPAAPTVVDASGATWTIGALGKVLRNGVWVGGGLGSTLVSVDGVIYTLGVDNNWWGWQPTSQVWTSVGRTQPTSIAGTSNTTSAAAVGGASSPDGTTIPPATQIVDTGGAVWTLGAGAYILRNGQRIANGQGVQLLWSGGVIYTLGIDNNWWEWQPATQRWNPVNRSTPAPSGGTSTSSNTTSTSNTPTSSPSPDGTMAPPASQIVDASGAVWTIGSSGYILKNGGSAGGGQGSKLLYSGGVIYTYGGDRNWWEWKPSSNGWTKVGPNQPGPKVQVTPSPNGAMVPSNTQLTDTNGNVWTIGDAGRILRDGVWAAGGLGSKLLWTSGAIYTLGTDGNWWGWQPATGQWFPYGRTQPR